MTLSFHDLEFRAELPEIPRSMPVVQTIAQCAPERSRTIRSLAEHWDLGELTEIGVPWGHALGNEVGQVEFLSASGAIRGRNLQVVNAFEDERRDWPDVEAVDTPDGRQWEVGERFRRDLINRSRALLERIGLAEDASSTDVSVGQWVMLDEYGEELDSGPGRITVRLSYTLDDLAFIGPGSKTLLHYDPIGREPHLARVFHVHRGIGDIRSVDIGDAESAFWALLVDPYLVEQVRRGGKVVITGVKVGLLSLPADVAQRFAVPSLAVEGWIEGLTDDEGRPFEPRFGRYVPMVAPDVLHHAGVVVADTLTSSTVSLSRKTPDWAHGG